MKINLKDKKINLSIENESLGTWGAVINAKKFVNKELFYVIWSISKYFKFIFCIYIYYK